MAGAEIDLWGSLVFNVWSVLKLFVWGSWVFKVWSVLKLFVFQSLLNLYGEGDLYARAVMPIDYTHGRQCLFVRDPFPFAAVEAAGLSASPVSGA